jgi:hypothetical protein
LQQENKMRLNSTELLNENLLDLDVSYSSFTANTLPKLISIKGGLNGKFCSDTETGLKCLQDSNDKGYNDLPKREEQFIVEPLGGDFVALRSAKNYRYVSDTPDGLMSTADVVDTWERFKIESLGGNQIALKGGRSGRYVTQLPNDVSLFSSGFNSPSLSEFISKVVNKGNLYQDVISKIHRKPTFSGKLVAEGSSVGEWQKFSIFPIPSVELPSQFTIKNELDKFCRFNSENNRIVCDDNTFGLNLQLEKIGANLIALKSGNRYLSDNPDGIKATATKVLGWEVFTFLDLGNGKFKLKGGRSNKFCRDTSNGLICDSDSYNDGSVFTIGAVSLRPRTGMIAGESINPIEDLKTEEQKQEEAIQREQELLDSQKILGMPRKTAIIVGVSLGVLVLGIATVLIIKKVKSKK